MSEMGEHVDILAEVEALIYYRFRDRELLREAFTHRSFTNESGALHARDNERLEFLGDAVLGLLVGHLLYTRYPRADEGELTRLRSSMVDEPALAGLASSLDLGRFMLLGKGAEREGVRRKPSILASLFEALVAAVYLDGGMRAVRRVFLLHLLHVMPAAGVTSFTRDSKSCLQELLQAAGTPPPVYRLVAGAGPDHDRTFTVEVVSDGVVLGAGSGRSKKSAEQSAARSALEAFPRPAASQSR
jgi:ribonuclease-3